MKNKNLYVTDDFTFNDFKDEKLLILPQITTVDFVDSVDCVVFERHNFSFSIVFLDKKHNEKLRILINNINKIDVSFLDKLNQLIILETDIKKGHFYYSISDKSYLKKLELKIFFSNNL